MTGTVPGPPASPLDLFLALVRIGSPSGEEGRLAHAIADWLAAAGVSCSFDDAASVTGSNTGNLIARSRRSASRPTVLFVAHLDTVQRADSVVRPILGDDGVVRSAGNSILGADNKAAVAALLTILATGRADHANTVVAFTTTEERGRMGVTALDVAEEVDYAFPVDGSYPVGTALEAALGQVPFDLRIIGREAHAAKDPEKGINAVKTACDIVARVELGWCNSALLNISEIRGGGETNIVPGLAVIRGEARAFSQQPLDARLEELEALAADVAGAAGAGFELVRRPEDGAPPFPPTDSARCVQLAEAAAADAGLTLSRQRCSATLEANFLAAMGLPTLGIASGGRDPHSVDESLPASELERLVELLGAILTRAGAADAR